MRGREQGSTVIELAPTATRAVEDDLVLAVVVEVDEKGPPLGGGLVGGAPAFDADELGCATHTVIVTAPVVSVESSASAIPASGRAIRPIPIAPWRIQHLAE